MKQAVKTKPQASATSIAIDPVTRIEGHARVFIHLTDSGDLESCGLIVNELRGFERILVGMEADRMPLVTARICGVCPTAHHLAATNALDKAAGVTPPPAAQLLRELMYMGHLIHSHSLSLFVLQGPDLILGLDADPAIRNVVGVVQANPEVAKMALRLRSIGQQINEMVGGRGTHPVTSVAGGITFTLDKAKHEQLKTWIDEGLTLIDTLAPVVKQLLLKQIDRYPELLDWESPSWSLSSVQDDIVSMTSGTLRFVDEHGRTQTDFPVEDYDKHLVETVLEWSYMKPVSCRNNGQKQTYRVGPMARLNTAKTYGQKKATKEAAELAKIGGNPCHKTVLQAYARLVELIASIERAYEIVNDKNIWGETRIPVQFKHGRGVGHVEAPRGTLIHDYEIDDEGIVRSANLIVATQQNYKLINDTVEHAVRSFVLGKQPEDALVNAVEFGIRCYDPCLSCATHAYGEMPLEIVISQGGETRNIRRAS